MLRANNTRVTRGYKTGEAACALLFMIDKLMSSLLEGKAFSRSINSCVEVRSLVATYI